MRDLFIQCGLFQILGSLLDPNIEVISTEYDQHKISKKD